MAAKLTPQQSPQAASSSFWQLISGVAHDLDLMLQDLFPDSIPSPLREEYGLTNDLALADQAFVNHPSLLEQFMRGAGDEGCPPPPPALEDPSCGEYRSSRSVLPDDTPTSDSYDDGRTTPTSTSSPSPPPPAPPPRTTNLQQQQHYSTNNFHCMAASSCSGGGQPTMVSSSSVSSVQETSDGDSSHTSSSFAPCDIGLLERLIRTHPIWFLPGIGRAGAVHLLQGKDVGNFIVRQSSKPNTMALSVRLPENKGPYVEHYLIETVGDAQLRLEGSDNNFHAIPMLVAHYCQCCDELPVQLALPRSLAQAVSRQELSSLALLGQDFWLSSLVQSPSSGSPPGQIPDSSISNSSGQHSTFKPSSETSKRSGPSPPNTLALNSQQSHSQDMHNDQQTSNVSSPPPPIAPKHQTRGAPPPPPPRSFQSSRSPSCANIAPLPSSDPDTSSPDLSSPANNNEYNGQSDADADESNNVTPKLASNEKKADKKTSRVAHYKQSNIVDLPSKYYKSSLADKISDYEDIWGNSVSKEKKSNLTTFQSSMQKLDPGYVDSLKRKNLDFFRGKHSDDLILAKFKYTYTKGTQTEVPGGKKMQFTALQMVQNEIMGDIALNGKMSNVDCTNHNVVSFNDEITYSPSEEANFPSPFYSEPVDSLPLDDDDSNSKRASIFNGELNILPQRFFNHRFSDPNLHWPQNMSCKKIDTLDEERVGSLSSSVDNIKGLGPSPQHRRQQALGLSTDWVHELHQRVSSHNLLKRDTETQVSNLDLHMSSVPEPNHMSSPVKTKTKAPNSSWPVDSSWEWLAHEDSSDDDLLSSTLGSKFPLYIKSKHSESQFDDSTTVEDLIALKSPELSLPEIRPLTQSNLMRVSEYDNLGCPPDPEKESHKLQVPEVIDDTATEFSEPWDSLRWERLLRLVIPETDILGDDDIGQREKFENNSNAVQEQNGKNQDKQVLQESPGNKFYDSESASTVSAFSDVTSDGVEDTSISEYPRTTLDRERNKSFQDRLEPLLAAPRITALRNKSTFGDNIRQYIFRLSEERNNTFAMSIENFIQCTKESNETNPAVVMRNIRQFMSGMKNYLVKHGEGHFEQLVQEERGKLKSNEFLNIDAIIEAALHKLVIKPLKSYIYQLFVNEYTRNGSLRLLSDNIKFARTKSPEELGIRPEFKPPEGASFEVVQHFLTRLQQAYSPLRKLESLLAAISAIYNSVRQDNTLSKDHASLAPDDFLPIFIYVLVQCGLLAAEIEADYMWGLLHPSLMYGEAGYYLTTLSSAVHVLKSLQACSPESPQHTQQPFDQASAFENGPKSELGSPKGLDYKTSSPEPRLPCIADLQGFMKIMIPDELTGSIIFKTLPVRPNMTTKDVVKMIAHKFNVTNPQDYCLFKLLKGEEILLGDNECPQSIKAELVASGTDCVFAYKRCDAKFIWPMMENS